MKVELEDGEWKALEDLRVVDLRALLGKYDLSKTGTKPVLLKRLQTYLEEIEEQKKNEEAKEEPIEEPIEEPKEEPKEETPVVVVEAEPEPQESAPQADSPLMLEADVNEFKDEKVEAEAETERSQSPQEATTEKRKEEEEEEEKSPPEPAPAPLPATQPAEENVSKSNEKENHRENGGEESSSLTASPLPKPSIPFRKLNKSISKEERKPRAWSDASLPEEPAEAVSTESLKDIIPDLKPLLENQQPSGLEEGIEEEKKNNKPKQREAQDDGSEEGEIPSASPSKRPRIDPPAPPAAAVSQGDETDVLLIRNLVRPFTLTQLKELLKRTGTVEDFWINKIKSHCFVRFSKVDEASETRHALDGVKWPSSNTMTLSVTFSTRKKMEETAEENTSFEATSMKKNDVPSKEEGLKFLASKEKVQSSETKEESSVKPQLLDDLFRKTKTTPCIYWTMNEKSLKKGKEERKKVEVAS